MEIINVTEAKATLSSILAQIEKGKEFVIARGDEPVAIIKKYTPQKRKLGAFRGQVKIPENFDTWPEDMKEFFGM